MCIILFVFGIAIKLSISIKKEVNLSKPAEQTITEVKKNEQSELIVEFP